MHCMMYLYPVSTAVLQKSIKTMPRLAVLYCKLYCPLQCLLIAGSEKWRSPG